MKNIIALLMVAIIVFHFSIVFNPPKISFPTVSIKLPHTTFKPGILVPHTTLPTAGTIRPVVHIHSTFFNFR